MTSHRNLTGRLLFAFALIIAVGRSVFGQVGEPEAAQPDTLPPQLPVAAFPPVGFLPAEPGTALDSVPNVQRRWISASEALSGLPGSFLYTPGLPDWPQHWSPFGLDGRHVTLTLNGRPFQNLITGQPDFELLPVEFLEPLRLGGAFNGSPLAVHGNMRHFRSAEPITEIRYRQGGQGLQGVSVIHAQDRRVDLFGRPGLLNAMFGYRGRGVNGAYPNSRSGLRTVSGRLRYEQISWSLEILNHRSRINRGAHTGVLPRPGLPYESIFIPFGAEVGDARAHARTTRNDFSASLRWRWSERFPQPLNLSTYWISQNHTYVNPTLQPGELFVVVNRYGGRLDQKLPGHLPYARLEVWLDHVKAQNALAEGSPSALGMIRISGLDSVRIGALDVLWRAGLGATEGSLQPEAAIELGTQSGWMRWDGALSFATRQPSILERYGFGAMVTGDAHLPSQSILFVGTGVSLHGTVFDGRIGVFAHQTDRIIVLDPAGDRGLDVEQVDASHSSIGVNAGLGWRTEARRGLWIGLQATAQHGFGNEPVHQRLIDSHPALHGELRLGVRALLFEGDMDLDLYVRSRGWSSMRSLRLNAPTSLYALPNLDDRVLGPSGTLDIFAEAGVRTATVFASYENVLAGTAIYQGTLIIPDYPLPGRFFRFGVYWPIFN